MIDRWNKAREDTGNINYVIELIRKGMFDIRGKRCKKYIFNSAGKQRRRNTRGEGKIEEQLLSAHDSTKKSILLKNGKVIKRIHFISNAVGLGSRKKGNVITDLFGIDEIGSPIAGEVKVNHQNPWYAVVECVEQVALMRADRKNLLECLYNKIPREIRGVGAWGLVIAPYKYWQKPEFASANKLIERLRRKTKIRICCVVYNPKDPVDLEIICGFPPSTRQAV